MFKFKLMLFGFTDMCQSFQEVKDHLKNIPAQRANYEGIDQCYMIDLSDGVKYQIILENGHFIVKGYGK